MFAFDLALALGECNPDAMLRRIPLPTFYDWLEYAKRKPFGDERADLRAAFIASEAANNGHYAHKRAMRPIDYMPFSKGHAQRRKQTPDQMRMVLKGIAGLHKQKTGQIAVKQAEKAGKGPRIDDRPSDAQIHPENA